ncbi:hypothetical protein [Microbacterium immunditiarum]|uniref:hypothetical protein n=1 Tax=Microbacterium immunditiarum TaxID=337480 RepID=UPI0015CB386A|nr:hypothetical protein [Microbacterium immunditiarum]
MIGVEQPTAVVVAERMRTLRTFDRLKDIDAPLAFVVVGDSVLRLSIRKGVESHGDPAEIDPRIEGTLHTLRQVLRILP